MNLLEFRCYTVGVTLSLALYLSELQMTVARSRAGRPKGCAASTCGTASTCAELKILQIDKIYLERGFDPFFANTKKVREIFHPL